MSSEEAQWLETLEEDALLLHRIGDHSTAAEYQACRRTIRASGRDEMLPHARRRFIEFDGENGVVIIHPIRTYPGSRFLQPKYPRLQAIEVELEPFGEPETDHEAEAVLEQLPEGLIEEWRWGLGVKKVLQPIVDSVGRLEIEGEDSFSSRSRTLRITRFGSTHVAGGVYHLHLRDFDNLRRGLVSIQARHQNDGLEERAALAHNTLLSEPFPDRHPPKRLPYRPDTLVKVITGVGDRRLSRQDRKSLVAEAGRRAPELAASEPDDLKRLRNSVDMAALDVVIERFTRSLQRTTTEQVWQSLFEDHPFILGMLFGHPVVLVRAQAAVGGMGYDGRSERYVDFLLKTEATNSAAIVELKRPNTLLVQDSEYAGVHGIHSELTRAVMQILDQRDRFRTYLHAKRTPDEPIEGWYVTCVVVAGTSPEDGPRRKALELYRTSLKDVVVITYDELLCRLETLRHFLSDEGPAPPDPAEPIF